MTSTLLSSATSGMLAAQIGFQTAQHNISNQNTAGFNRQRIIQATNIAMSTGAGFIGQGAHVSTVERMYDRVLTTQVNSAQTSVSELGSYYTEVSKIDNMLADANSGLSPAMADFFNGVKQVAANPAQLSSRQAMLSAAQALAARYQSIESRLQEMYDGVNNQIVTQVGTINSYAQQISDINQSIILAQSATSQPANDLLDQRDQLVANLNKLVSVQTTINTDGSYNVFFGTGQQLVVGTQVKTLTAAPSSADASRIAIGLVNGSSIQEMPESLIAGGSVAGLLKFRSEALDKTADEVGRNAASLALTFNAQNALGQDLLGKASGDTGFVSDFFTLSQPRVVANSHNDTAANAVVSATLMPPSINGGYTLSLDSAGTTYTLMRQSDGKIWTDGNIAGLQGKIGTGAPDNLDLTGAFVAAGKSTVVANADSVGANFYTKLAASDYRLSYDGTNYTMTRLSDTKQWSDASLNNLSSAISASEGFSISLTSGAMSSGDSFIIEPVRQAARNLNVNTPVANDARLVAAGMAVKTAASSSNTGTGAISTAGVLPGFATSSFSGDVTATYNSTTGQFDMSGLLANSTVYVTSGGTTNAYAVDGSGNASVTYTSGATISSSGVSFSISGNLVNNDKFTLSKNTAGVSDSRNATLLGKLQTQYTMTGATASYATAYAQLVSYVGNKTSQVSVTQEAQQSLLDQAQAARESMSGVNLDEEASNLIKYQQAYQASAKALQIGTSLFDTLVGIMR